MPKLIARFSTLVRGSVRRSQPKPKRPRIIRLRCQCRDCGAKRRIPLFILYKRAAAARCTLCGGIMDDVRTIASLAFPPPTRPIPKKPKKRSPRKRQNAYGERNRILQQMGFPTYTTYLASDLWKSIQRDDYQCVICRQPAHAVHHKRYCLSTLSGRNLNRLLTLCKSCHDYIEFDNSKKRPPEDVAQRLRELQSAVRMPPPEANGHTPSTCLNRARSARAVALA
ncbi:MAG: hypothetical protein FD153_1638 [Rhodospirillaceae bacterium]|nr:MAG: hypothetical protein FD153_1638 [Rhodospirillaceae bacterium]